MGQKPSSSLFGFAAFRFNAAMFQLKCSCMLSGHGLQNKHSRSSYSHVSSLPVHFHVPSPVMAHCFCSSRQLLWIEDGLGSCNVTSKLFYAAGDLWLPWASVAQSSAVKAGREDHISLFPVVGLFCPDWLLQGLFLWPVALSPKLALLLATKTK